MYLLIRLDYDAKTKSKKKLNKKIKEFLNQITDKLTELASSYLFDILMALLIIIVGTRPEIIRLAAVIKKCRKYFDCVLAHTGQNYDYNLNGVFFKDLKLAESIIEENKELVITEWIKIYGK